MGACQHTRADEAHEISRRVGEGSPGFERNEGPAFSNAKMRTLGLPRIAPEDSVRETVAALRERRLLPASARPASRHGPAAA